MISAKIIWTKEKIINDMYKYKNLNEYRTKSKSYNIAIKNKMTSIIHDYFNIDKKKWGYWTKERCKEEALKYKYRKEFIEKSNSCYCVSISNGWLDEICSHMERLIKEKNYWTKEKCLNESKKYNSISELQNNNFHVYNLCRENKWLDEINYYNKRKPPIFWSKDKCIIEIKKYSSKKDFREKSNSCYRYCSKNNILEEIYQYL